MSRRLHLILGTDTPICDLFRLGMGSYLRSLLEAYGGSFEVEVHSPDHEDFSQALGVRHHRVGFHPRAPRRFRQIAYYFTLLRHARKMRGLIRCMSPNLPILPEIRRISRSPVVLDYHYDWESTSRRHYGGLKGRLAGPFQRRCVGSADIVVATTRDLAHDAAARYGARTITIPNFVDTDLFHPGTSRSGRIVFAGRFHWAKGVPVLISAFERIADGHPGSELILFGSGEQDEELRLKVPEALRSRIRFRGSRPHEEVAEELGSAAVSVLPTLTTEGNPKAVQEAMACGTPLICSAVPGLTNLIEVDQTGILVPPGDVEALAEAIARLFDDPALWARMSKAGLARAHLLRKERILRYQTRVMQIGHDRGRGGERTRVRRGGRGRGASGQAGTIPGIAVVIVAFGAQGPLERCIASIARQTVARAARLIVVDNNPPGGKCDRIRLREAAHGAFPVEIISPEANLGYGRAINLALEHVREDLIMIANPDLVVGPGTFGRLEETLRSSPEAAAVGPRLLRMDGATPARVSTRLPRLASDLAGLAGIARQAEPDHRGAAYGEGAASVEFLSGACFMARRRALNQIGGFDPRFFLYYEDADLFRRLADDGWKLLLVPSATVQHEHGGTWEDTVRRQEEAFRGAILYHRKHGGPGASLLYRSGLLILYIPRIIVGGVALRILGRKSIFSGRDRFRILGRTARLVFSPIHRARERGNRAQESRP